MSLEQVRAIAAHRAVEAVSKDEEAKRKRYATVVYQSIPLIHNSGLVQTIEFLKSLSNAEKREQAERFLQQLARHLIGVDPEIKDLESLAKRAREAKMAEYMVLTREVMATLVWFRRFVQSVLKIHSAADEE